MSRLSKNVVGLGNLAWPIILGGDTISSLALLRRIFQVQEMLQPRS